MHILQSHRGGLLFWSELNEVIMDVETQLNHRPLSYVEDDLLLTPAFFLFQKSIHLPEREPWRQEDYHLRRWEKYLRSCKDALWKCWTPEYLTALRERHNLNGRSETTPLEIGDVTIIHSEEKNRGKGPWYSGRAL